MLIQSLIIIIIIIIIIIKFIYIAHSINRLGLC